MKNAKLNINPRKPVTANKPSPEIRDNLDSRKNEEQNLKGDDITHNKKEYHQEPKAKNKSD